MLNPDGAAAANVFAIGSYISGASPPFADDQNSTFPLGMTLASVAKDGQFEGLDHWPTLDGADCPDRAPQKASRLTVASKARNSFRVGFAVNLLVIMSYSSLVGKKKLADSGLLGSG
jgi:hypothetical protein